MKGVYLLLLKSLIWAKTLGNKGLHQKHSEKLGAVRLCFVLFCFCLKKSNAQREISYFNLCFVPPLKIAVNH